jgi:hypothetical protein
LSFRGVQGSERLDDTRLISGQRQARRARPRSRSARSAPTRSSPARR